ncbi:MAG: hypothetical protein ABIQ15_15790 [Nocardioides sp.]
MSETRVRPAERPAAADPVLEMFASSSVIEHVVRGLVGLALVVLTIGLAPEHPWALLGLVPAALAWRGCPTCWLLGLGQTLSRGRTRACADGCETRAS